MKSSLLVASLLLVIIAISWFAIARLIDHLLARDIVDRPNHRTLHQGAIPRGGGLVIITMLIITLFVIALLSARPQLFVCLAGLVFAWAGLSWWDDRADLSPKFRIIIQLVICIFTVSALGWVSHLYSVNLFWLGPVLSVIGLLWMANLYNFMDGLDGLAASQTIIACITLAFWFLVLGDLELSLTCAILAASSYGFLLWNWSPAKIFMGDVGSISLGAFFGTIFIVGVTRFNLSIISFFGLFAVFIADATVTICIRVWRREKIWLPHRQHFYQRLANAGYAHSSIALAYIILMLICSVLATLGVIYHDMITHSLIAIIATLAIAAATIVYFEKRPKT